MILYHIPHKMHIKKHDQMDRKPPSRPATQCLMTLASRPDDAPCTTGQYRIDTPPGLQLQGMESVKKN